MVWEAPKPKHWSRDLVDDYADSIRIYHVRLKSGPEDRPQIFTIHPNSFRPGQGALSQVVHACLSPFASFFRPRSSYARLQNKGRYAIARFRWAIIAGRLLEAGWLVPPSKTHFSLCVCPPAGTWLQRAEKKRKRWACGLYHACPWCWCRQLALPLFKKLVFLCPSLIPAVRPSRRYVSAPPGEVDFSLLELHVRVAAKIDRVSAHQMEKIAARLLDRKRIPIPRKHIRGLFFLQTLEPALRTRDEEGKVRWVVRRRKNFPDEQPSHWVLRHRLLLVIDKETPPLDQPFLRDRLPRARISVRRHSLPTCRRDLIRLVGRLCRFPAGLLHSEWAHWSVQALNALGRTSTGKGRRQLCRATRARTARRRRHISRREGLLAGPVPKPKNLTKK